MFLYILAFLKDIRALFKLIDARESLNVDDSDKETTITA
jgi:hypothetical protein